jgi:hypothetical protein
MYHIGKVMKILRKGKDIVSSDGTVQATCGMWDDNQITFLVDGAIAEEIKENDIVLVDYRPMPQHNMPTPSQTIVKIIRGRTATELWESYKEYFEKKKKEQEPEYTKQKYVH